MFVGFLLYLTEPRRTDSAEHYSRAEFAMVFFYFVLFVVVLLGFVIQAWLNPALKTSLGYAASGVLICLLTTSFSVYLLFTRTLSARIKRGKFISQVFFVAIVIALVLFPHISADAWGRSEGIMAKDNYPLVELYAPYQAIDDIQWELTTTNSFWTVDSLYLLYSNQQCLAVQSVVDGSSVYIVPIHDILSIKVVASEE